MQTSTNNFQRANTLKLKIENSKAYSVSPNDQVDVNTSVDSEVSDLLNDGRWAVNVNNSLVDAHLVAIIGVSTIAARGATSRDSEHLGGDANNASSLVALLLGSAYDFGTSVFKWLHLLSAESHSDSLDYFLVFFSLCLVLI